MFQVFKHDWNSSALSDRTLNDINVIGKYW